MKAQFIGAALALCVAFPSAQAAKIDNPVNQEVVASKKIDLNTADLSSLIGSVKGIGKKRAQAIIAYRESHQGFKSIEELAEVKGLGQHFVSVNREKLTEVFALH